MDLDPRVREGSCGAVTTVKWRQGNPDGTTTDVPHTKWPCSLSAGHDGPHESYGQADDHLLLSWDLHLRNNTVLLIPARSPG